MAGYSGTPLPQKLGIKPGRRTLLLSAPPGFEQVRGPLAEGSVVLRRAGQAHLTIWFVRRMRELASGIARRAAAVGEDGLWICWPKRSSGVATDVTESLVRDAALAHGIVDYKVAAIDETWSGLKFARRKATGVNAR